MCMALGGRAAEAKIFQRVTTGIWTRTSFLSNTLPNLYRWCLDRICGITYLLVSSVMLEYLTLWSDGPRFEFPRKSNISRAWKICNVLLRSKVNYPLTFPRFGACRCTSCSEGFSFMIIGLKRKSLFLVKPHFIKPFVVVFCSSRSRRWSSQSNWHGV